MSIIKDVQTIPTDELQAFEKRLLDKATVARERCNMLTEERNKLREEGAMCDIAIKAFKKRKGYQFGDPIPASAWLDIHAEDNDTTEEECHASPRPHMRRGHWHHFWTGPKNDETNRKLVLKWLSPMMISVDTEDVNENPVVIHEVK